MGFRSWRLEDMHTVGHKATRMMKPAIQGPSVRISAHQARIDCRFNGRRTDHDRAPFLAGYSRRGVSEALRTPQPSSPRLSGSRLGVSSREESMADPAGTAPLPGTLAVCKMRRGPAAAGLFSGFSAVRATVA